MSDFWDSLGKTVNDMANKAIKFSGDAVELTKASVNIKLDEIKRDGIFKEIGRIVYDNYKSDNDSIGGVCKCEEVIDFCKYIEEIEKDIEEQIVKAAHIKNKKFCVNCGTTLDKCQKYCYECGARQPEIVVEAESEEDCCCCCCNGDDSATTTETAESEEDCGCDGDCADGAASYESGDNNGNSGEPESAFGNFGVE